MCPVRLADRGESVRGYVRLPGKDKGTEGSRNNGHWVQPVEVLRTSGISKGERSHASVRYQRTDHIFVNALCENEFPGYYVETRYCEGHDRNFICIPMTAEMIRDQHKL